MKDATSLTFSHLSIRPSGYTLFDMLPAPQATMVCFNMDIILGLPGEGEEDVAYTMDEIQKLHPDSLTAQIKIFSYHRKKPVKFIMFQRSRSASSYINRIQYFIFIYFPHISHFLFQRIQISPYPLLPQSNRIGSKGTVKACGRAKNGGSGAGGQHYKGEA